MKKREMQELGGEKKKPCGTETEFKTPKAQACREDQGDQELQK